MFPPPSCVEADSQCAAHLPTWSSLQQTGVQQLRKFRPAPEVSQSKPPRQQLPLRGRGSPRPYPRQSREQPGTPVTRGTAHPFPFRNSEASWRASSAVILSGRVIAPGAGLYKEDCLRPGKAGAHRQASEPSAGSPNRPPDGSVSLPDGSVSLPDDRVKF